MINIVGGKMKVAFKNLRRLINDMDKPLLVVTLVLFLFGTLNIVTASSSEAISYNVSLYHYFYQQMKILFLGLFASYIIVNIPTKKWSFWAIIAYISVSILLLLTLRTTANRGAQNWIFGVQPSEFSKPILIVSLSLLFEKFYRKLRTIGINHYDMIGIILFVGLLFPIIVFLQKDFGSMFILFMIFAILFYASPILKIEKLQTTIFMGVLGIVGCFILLGVKGYILTSAQLSRFNFFDPCSRYETGGYQICNSFIAINDGGITGVGVGKSKQKYSYIPEAHTDSVFAIIVEEYGLLSVTLIFLAYIFILKRIADISFKATTMRGQYMALGVLTYIFMHILINLGGLFGVMPLTGVPLPFLSYGGSFGLSLLVALAIVQRIHIETRREKIRV